MDKICKFIDFKQRNSSTYYAHVNGWFCRDFKQDFVWSWSIEESGVKVKARLAWKKHCGYIDRITYHTPIQSTPYYLMYDVWWELSSNIFYNFKKIYKYI